MKDQRNNNRTFFRRGNSDETAEFFNIVLDNIRQGMVVVGPDYSVLAFNKQFEELFRLPQGTIEVGRDFREVLKVWADRTGQTQDMLEQSIGELDLPTQFEVELLLTIQGNTQWYLVHHNPLPTKGFVRTYSDITAKKTSDEQHMHDAFHDSLTGLPNRALFMDRLQHVIAASQRRRSTSSYAVFFLDLDKFKIINDSHGHIVGDLLLIAVSRKLTECIRPGDTIARLSGDEFALL